MGTPRAVKVLAMLLLPVIVAAIVASDTNPGPNETLTKPTPAVGPSTSAKPYANSPEGKPPGLSALIPDPKEALETKPAGQLPDFISQVDAPLRDKVTPYYKGAVDNYDAYSHIPCFCGCAIYTHPHHSLAECYIKSKDANGNLTFTDHSSTCDLCQAAAQMTVQGLAQNTPVKDIRAAVFQKLKYTDIWTDTPAP